jgi:hypothetical protein
MWRRNHQRTGATAQVRLSSTLPPRSNDDMRITFLDAPSFPQSVESHGHIEGFTATEQTTNLANGPPGVVAQFEYLLIERLGGVHVKGPSSSSRTSTKYGASS